MRKILCYLLLILLFGICVGCSNKNYEPKNKAEYNEVYRSTTNVNDDGSYPVINVEKVEIIDGDIVVTVPAPEYETLRKGLKEYIAFTPKDEKGETLTLDKITIENIGDKSEFIITGSEVKDAKYIEICPFKVSQDNTGWAEYVIK